MSEIGNMWYTQYRPYTMEEYSGPTIKNTVSRRFTKKDNFPHTVYVKGPRGTGKTTLARILTKYYLCLNPHEDGTPCEECEMCTSINEILISGNSLDVECPGVQEIDSTTASGKEAISQIMEDALQAPIYTPYKIIIFDECHMITVQAQNSLLKLIEDIPKHLICIFCTTNDEKVLQTIKSRMQLNIEAKKQSVPDMVNRLMVISEKENLTVSKEALEVIARKGNRVPRECINILEAIAKTYDRQVTIENVREHLGGISSEIYLDYFKAAHGSLSQILQFVKMLKIEDVKLAHFVSGLMAFALDSMYIKHGISLEDYPPDYIKSVKELFEMYNSSDFDMLLQILEYLSNSITAEDDAKNELLITTTAMRISKIQLLANGLANEQKEAITENKISLYEHSKKLKVDNDMLSEQMKVDLNTADMKESFDEIRQVVNTQNLLDGVKVPDFIFENKDNVEEDRPNLDLGSEVDDFFDNN